MWLEQVRAPALYLARGAYRRFISAVCWTCAGANVIVPLETLLTTPIIISFDEETRKQYPYTFCNSVGCVARIGLTENEVSLLKTGAVAKITVVHISRPNQPITFDMSLKGFTAAYNKTTVIGQ